MQAKLQAILYRLIDQRRAYRATAAKGADPNQQQQQHDEGLLIDYLLDARDEHTGVNSSTEGVSLISDDIHPAGSSDAGAATPSGTGSKLSDKELMDESLTFILAGAGLLFYKVFLRIT